MAELPSGAVTILATDLEHSVGLWDDDEEAMSEALARHDRMLREVVIQHRGHVIKGTGDGLWAAFEQPRAALDAAIEIQDVFRATAWGEIGELRVRVVVHTGDAEWRDGDVYGATANRVARMLELVEGGQIFASEATIRLAGVDQSAPFGVRSLGSRELRGLRQPLHVFELLPGPRATADASNAHAPQLVSTLWKSDRGEPPDRSFEPAYPFPTPELLVGRQGDLLIVRRVLERGRHEGRTILIGAPAGTGKSTLAGMFVDQARELGFLCLAGGSFDQESPTPYGPIRDALCDYLLALSPDRLRADFGELATDLEPIVPELRYHTGRAGTQEGAVPDAGRLQAAVHGFLRGLATHQPVLLCLEDLHAADDATLQMVHYLARQTRRSPIVLVATYRSEEVSTHRPLERLLSSLKRQTLAQEIMLRPLEREETLVLMSSLLDGPVSDDLTDSLFSVTEGNPLFVEQLVLALREEHRIDQRDGVWYQVTSDTTPVPPLVHSVIERRFDRLPPSARDTLEMAAVLGQTFDLPTLVAALAIDQQEAVVVVLDRAIDAQLVRETASGYRFGHSMIREALYRNVTGLRRAMLHAQAGEAIERLAGDRTVERAGELALHFSLATAVAPTVAKAVQYSLEAGRRAAALSSHREALDHYSRAWTLIGAQAEPDDAVRLQAIEGRALAERERGMWTSCIASCRSLIELTDDPTRRGWARTSICRALTSLGDTVHALREVEAGLAELGPMPETVESAETARVRVRLMYDRSYLLFMQGRFHDVVALGREMLKAAIPLGESEGLFLPHYSMGLGAMGLHQADQAFHHLGQAIKGAAGLGVSLSQAAAYELTGITHYRAGQFDAATARLNRALELYREMGSDLRAVNAVQTFGRVLLAQGDVPGALQQARSALSHVTGGRDRWAAQCYDLLGMIQMLRAEWASAATSFEQALVIHDQTDNFADMAESITALGTVAELQGEWARAEELYRRAMAVADRMDPSPEQIAPRRQLARLLLRSGRHDADADHLQQALALAESMRPTIDEGPTLLVLAECQLRDGEHAEALSTVDRALSVGGAADFLVEANTLAAEARLAVGNLDAAREHAVRARAIAERLGAPRPIGQAQLATARVDSAAGEHQAGLVAFEVALRALEEAQTPYELAVTAREFGRMLLRTGRDRARGHALLETASTTFERLGALLDLEACRQRR